MAIVECIIATLTKLRLDPVHHLVVNIGFLVSCVQVMFVGHFDFTTAYHPKGFLEYHQASVLALHDGEHCQHSYACSLWRSECHIGDVNSCVQWQWLIPL